MRIPVLTMAVAVALAGCASTGGGKLAVCDGKHLRPANPYGTVLAPSTGGEPPAAAGSGDSKPKSLSSTAATRSFGSC
jgi:type IV secretion system protein VirB7